MSSPTFIPAHFSTPISSKEIPKSVSFSLEDQAAVGSKKKNHRKSKLPLIFQSKAKSRDAKETRHKKSKARNLLYIHGSSDLDDSFISPLIHNTEESITNSSITSSSINNSSINISNINGENINKNLNLTPNATILNNNPNAENYQTNTKNPCNNCFSQDVDSNGNLSRLEALKGLAVIREETRLARFQFFSAPQPVDADMTSSTNKFGFKSRMVELKTENANLNYSSSSSKNPSIEDIPSLRSTPVFSGFKLPGRKIYQFQSASTKSKDLNPLVQERQGQHSKSQGGQEKGQESQEKCQESQEAKGQEEKKFSALPKKSKIPFSRNLVSSDTIDSPRQSGQSQESNPGISQNTGSQFLNKFQRPDGVQQRNCGLPRTRPIDFKEFNEQSKREKTAENQSELSKQGILHMNFPREFSLVRPDSHHWDSREEKHFPNVQIGQDELRRFSAIGTPKSLFAYSTKAGKSSQITGVKKPVETVPFFCRKTPNPQGEILTGCVKDKAEKFQRLAKENQNSQFSYNNVFNRDSVNRNSLNRNSFNVNKIPEASATSGSRNLTGKEGETEFITSVNSIKKSGEKFQNSCDESCFGEMTKRGESVEKDNEKWKGKKKLSDVMNRGVPDTSDSEAEGITRKPENVISDSEFLIDDEISDQPELTFTATFKDSSLNLSPSSSGESLNSGDLIIHPVERSSSFVDPADPLTSDTSETLEEPKMPITTAVTNTSTNSPSYQGGNKSPGGNKGPIKIYSSNSLISNRENIKNLAYISARSPSHNGLSGTTKAGTTTSPGKGKEKRTTTTTTTTTPVRTLRSRKEEKKDEGKKEETQEDLEEISQLVSELKGQLEALALALEESAKESSEKDARLKQLEKENEFLKRNLKAENLGRNVNAAVQTDSVQKYSPTNYNREVYPGGDNDSKGQLVTFRIGRQPSSPH